LDYNGNEFTSSVKKRPTNELQKLEKLGFVNDSIVDVEHGGEHMAVHVFSHDHYPFFNQQSGLDLPIPTFGENLTISDLNEQNVNVGDIWKLGSAVVQISQPTERCRTMGRLHHQPKLLKWIHMEMMTGFYIRVLEEGEVSQTSSIEIIEKGPDILNIDHLNQVLFKRPKVLSELEQICSFEVLSPRWKKSALKQFKQRNK
jgi:MOSC domain-containing protein YiiM